MCGICGVVAHHPDDLVPLLLDLTETNLSRGEDGVGNTVINPTTGTMRRYVNVRKQDSDESPMIPGHKKEIERLAGELQATMGLGQTKFTTVGLSTEELVVKRNTQPIHLVYPRTNHMTIPEGVIIGNEDISIPQLRDNITASSLSEAEVDTRYAGELFYEKMRELGNPWDAAEWAMMNYVGAGTFGFSDGTDLFFFTLPTGIRPGVVGKKEGKHGPIYVLSSEDGYFDEFGIETMFHMQGGEAVQFRSGEEPERRTLVKADQSPCWYERHYLQRSFSTINGEKTNAEFRREEARTVARLYQQELSNYEMLFYVPNSGIAFERGVADVIDVPAKLVCRKPGRGTTRFYLSARSQKKHQYVFSRTTIEGRDGVGIEDSAVEGDTATRLFLDWKRYGGGKLAILSIAPPIFFPCPYGVGFPTQDNLITAGAFEAGVARMEDGEVAYDIHEINEFVTGEYREKIKAEAQRLNMVVDPNDFCIFYGTIDSIRDHTQYLSPSGTACDFCTSGRRSDYRQNQELVQLRVTAPNAHHLILTSSS